MLVVVGVDADGDDVVVMGVTAVGVVAVDVGVVMVVVVVVRVQCRQRGPITSISCRPLPVAWLRSASRSSTELNGWQRSMRTPVLPFASAPLSAKARLADCC